MPAYRLSCQAKGGRWLGRRGKEGGRIAHVNTLKQTAEREYLGADLGGAVWRSEPCILGVKPRVQLYSRLLRAR